MTKIGLHNYSLYTELDDLTDFKSVPNICALIASLLIFLKGGAILGVHSTSILKDQGPKNRH